MLGVEVRGRRLFSLRVFFGTFIIFFFLECCVLATWSIGLGNGIAIENDMEDDMFYERGVLWNSLDG
jgi:hypothetical protein